MVDTGGDADLVERLARVEHEQWMAWSKSVAAEVSAKRRRGWQRGWIPYDKLTEEQKEHDREWARRALAAIERSAR
jgi:hypothetical protein